MAEVLLGLGSNTDRHKNLCAGLDALAQHFGDLALSPVYESRSVGFDGRNFYNLVARLYSPLSLTDTARILKAIEDANGRLRSGPKFSPRTLDIDILTYDQLTGLQDGIWLPREEITQNAFVLRPLADLAPHSRLPGSNQSYADLWAGYDQGSQALWPVRFIWQGRELTPDA